MPNIYEKLGVRTTINAHGPTTRLSGAIMPVSVAEAMAEATQYCVDVENLQARASEIIAEITGAEAGYVTSGAAAGLLLGTAACVTGLDPSKMDRLPDTEGMRNEVIIVRSQRNSYDHAMRAAGIRLIEVGISDRSAWTGVRDVEAWEIEDAVTERTAAIYYLAKPHSRPSLQEVVRVARDAGVPVLVDAAAQLPPVANLRRFIDDGADLVVFSGGKSIGGPQASGILCGRRDLIAPAALQHLDLDVLFELWEPPRALIDKGALPNAPRHGIGRHCKVGKEQIVGLLTALSLFVEEDMETKLQKWRNAMETLIRAVAEVPWVRAETIPDPRQTGIPMVELRLDESGAGLTAIELVRRLRAGTPCIEVNPSRVHDGFLIFGPVCLKDDEPEVIGRRLGEILGAEDTRKTGVER